MPELSTAKYIAGLLAERAAKVGLSQRQFADLVGASTKHVNLVFNGRVTAQLATLDEWADKLGVGFVIYVEEV